MEGDEDVVGDGLGGRRLGTEPLCEIGKIVGKFGSEVPRAVLALVEHKIAEAALVVNGRAALHGVGLERAPDDLTHGGGDGLRRMFRFHQRMLDDAIHVCFPTEGVERHDRDLARPWVCQYHQGHAKVFYSLRGPCTFGVLRAPSGACLA